MGRLCERPSCAAVGEIAYGFDTTLLLVWLRALDPLDDPNRAGVLCLRHADSMVLPRGWALDDAREAVPRLFRPRLVEADADPAVATSAPPGTVTPPAKRHKRRRAADGGRRTGTKADDGRLPLDPPSVDGEAVEAVADVTAVVLPELSAPEPAAPSVPDMSDETAALTVAAVTGVTTKAEPDATEALPWKPAFDVGDDLDGTLDAETPLLARAFRGTDRRPR